MALALTIEVQNKFSFSSPSLYRVIESHWFVWVTQSNHIPMEIDDDKARAWLPLQVCNYPCEICNLLYNTTHVIHSTDARYVRYRKKLVQ